MKKNVIILMVTFMFATMQTKAQCTHLALGTIDYKSVTGAPYDSLQLIVSQCNANNYTIYNNGMVYPPGYVVTVTGTNPATNSGSKKVAVLPNVAYLFQVKTTDLSCFSNFVAFTLPFVLPVKLLLFNATASDNKVKVTWTVESDQDADKYIVERSTDGRNFTEVGLVFAVNQTSKQDYSFTSALPIGVYYYRLKMVNKDAKIEYSNIAKVEIGSKQLGASITLMPNPVVSNLVLRLDGKALTSAEKIRISDITGKVIMSTTTQNSTVDVQHLSPGTYILEIISANNPPNTIKFVKQ